MAQRWALNSAYASQSMQQSFGASRGFATSFARSSSLMQSAALRQAVSASRKGFTNQGSGLMRRSGARLGVANGELLQINYSGCTCSCRCTT